MHQRPFFAIPSAKHEHWCGVWRVFGCEGAPVLVFVFKRGGQNLDST